MEGTRDLTDFDCEAIVCRNETSWMRRSGAWSVSGLSSPPRCDGVDGVGVMVWREGSTTDDCTR